MKTAISLPDDLFARADALARSTGKSRSRLYQDALEEYLDRRVPDAITHAMDEVCEAVATQPDEWQRVAAQRVLERNEW